MNFYNFSEWKYNVLCVLFSVLLNYAGADRQNFSVLNYYIFITKCNIYCQKNHNENEINLFNAY